MIKIEKIQVMGFEGALRGMRNPLDSWSKADTTYNTDGSISVLGPNDEDLMKRLTKAGTSHRKFLRMIHVQVDVTAPLYWWKEYDTYKIATTGNSCSTMHKIHEYKFTPDMFASEHLDQVGLNVLDSIINYLNFYRKRFLDSNKKDKDAWYNMIQMLPTSYMQKRTLDLNYENILPMLKDRHTHKQDEWVDFGKIMYENLPLVPMLYKAAYGHPMAIRVTGNKTTDWDPCPEDFKAKYYGVWIDNPEVIVYLVTYTRDFKVKRAYVDINVLSESRVSIDQQIMKKLCKIEKITPSHLTIIDYVDIDTMESGKLKERTFNFGGDVKEEDKCVSNMYPDVSYKIYSGTITSDDITEEMINTTKNLGNMQLKVDRVDGFIMTSGNIACDKITCGEFKPQKVNLTVSDEAALAVSEKVKEDIFKAIKVDRRHMGGK